jgi:hypothetical protein
MSEFLAPTVWPDDIWREPSRALAEASQEGRRRVATALPRIALGRNGLDGAEIAAGLEALERGQFGDDTDDAAGGALYEASHAVGDAGRAELVEMVLRELQ